MITGVLRQNEMKILPAFTEQRKTGQREADLQEVIRSIETFLPRYVNGYIETQIIHAEKELPVMINTAQIEMALLHLIRNALEAMPIEGRLTIKTGLTEIQSKLLGEYGGLNVCAFVSVSDTGYGMDEITLLNAFEPFYTTKEGSYRGLGLSTVYRTVKQNNGSINMESKPGQGTTVSVYLPLVRKTPVQQQVIPLPPA
jgi:signal transduction histidine kinase